MKHSLFAELRRRNVIRAAVLYIGIVWALSQGAAQLLPVFDVPNWVVRWFIVAAIFGFPFWIGFAWFYEITPEGLKRESAIEPSDSIARATGKKLDRWIIAVLGIAVVLLLTNQFVLHKPAEGAPEKSVAVLPLVNESGEKDQQYFSDGLSESLIVTLSQVSGLKVIGRNSSFRFRDTNDDSRTIGNKLGVANLIEGSVQRAGDTVRISAELIRAMDGSTIWTQRYDRPYKDLFALQDEITQSVAGAMKTTLLTKDASSMHTDRPPGGSLDAYAAYQRGNYYGTRNSEADWRKAIEQYGIATRLDPRYALAWAASAHASLWLAGAFLSGEEAEKFNAQAREAASTALTLEPNLAQAHAAYGELLIGVDFDWSGAERELGRALQITPTNYEAMENLGVLSSARGQPEKAIEWTRQSLAADPLRATGYLLLSRYYSGLGRFDDAEETIRRGIALQPTSDLFAATLTLIEIEKGNADGALATAQGTPSGIWQDYAIAMARQIGPDRAAADAALQLTIDKDAEGMAFQIAEIYGLRRDADHAFEWLDRALSYHDPGLQFLMVNPFLLRFRDDARFAAFCAKLGVPSTTSAKALP